MLQNVLEVASATDPGAVRDFNEDSIATHAGLGLLVLADGMGGHQAGDVASSLAVSVVVEEIKRRIDELRPGSDAGNCSLAMNAVRQALDKANLAIHERAQSDGRLKGMGTTAVVALFFDNRVSIASVGDSRLYRLRGGRFELLTRDHSLVQEQVAYGVIDAADAKLSHNRNLVTRALGVAPTVEFCLREELVQTGDLFVLCSDGLHDMVEQADLALVASTLQSNLPLAARQFVEIANDNGGPDNISVIVAKVLRPFPAGEAPAPRQGWLSRLFGIGR